MTVQMQNPQGSQEDTTPVLSDHDKAMIAKANESGAAVLEDGAPIPLAQVPADQQTNESQNEPAARPAWCPEQFWNAETGVADVEALAARNAELEAAVAPKDDKGKKDGEGAKDEKQEVADLPFVKAVDKANADLLEGGVLKDETYAEFEKIGLSRDHVDGWIEGQSAKAELVKMRVFGEAGGEESLTNMVQWGAQNYTETEQQMFDKMVNSGNVEQALGAVKALKARFEASEGKQGEVIVPAGQSNTGGVGYKSKDEVVADMKKPEYRTNAAFRAQVQGKIDASLKAGVDLGF